MCRLNMIEKYGSILFDLSAIMNCTCHVHFLLEDIAGHFHV